jgi:Transposase
MKSPVTEPFAARIGIDWGDAKHDICLLPEGTTTVERCVLTHSPEAIDEWVHALRNRFGRRPIAIALELDKGPLVYALQKYDGFVLFPVNPSMLARYRKAFTPSGAKDDPSDAELALDLLCRHPEQLAPLRPQSPPMRAVQQLVEQRRRLVADRVRLSNDTFDRVIAATTAQITDYALFEALPGAGPTHRVCWSSSANRATATTTPHKSKNTPASLRSPNAAANRLGCAGATRRRPSSARPSSSGPRKLFPVPSGRKRSTNNNAPKAAPTKPPCVHSPSNGSASCSVAGRIVSHTTRPLISTLSNVVAHHSSTPATLPKP